MKKILLVLLLLTFVLSAVSFTALADYGDVAFRDDSWVEMPDGSYELYESVTRYTTPGAEIGIKPRVYEGFTSDNTHPDNVLTGTVSEDELLVLNIHYKRNKHDVIYVIEGSIPSGVSGFTESDVYFDTEVEIAPAPEVEGYVFSGWSVNADNVDVTDNSFIMPNKDVVISGYFTSGNECEYTVEHYIQNLDGTYTTPAVRKTVCAKAGDEVVAAPYSFTGFTLDTGNALTVESGEASSELVLKLYYTRNYSFVRYRYTGFIPADATPLPKEGNKIKVLYGAQYTNEYPVPEADGYEFHGWLLNEHTVTFDSPDTVTVPMYEALYVGYFTKNPDPAYTVRHYLPGRENPVETYIKNGTSVEEFPLDIEHYEVDPALTEGFDETRGSVLATAESDGVLFVDFYYKLKNYTVSYDFNGGYALEGDYSDEDFEAGETLLIKKAIKRTGYNFVGWSVNGSDTVYAAGKSITLEGDITLKAVWQKKVSVIFPEDKAPVYKLTFETNGGEEIPAKTFDTETTVALDTIPTRNGYIFAGWFSDKSLSNNISEIKVDSEARVWAKWLEDKVPSRFEGEEHFAYLYGYEDGTVRPENNITRAEAVTIISRILKADVKAENKKTSSAFDDVADGMWYTEDVATLENMGVLKARSENNFAPNEAITRAEFADICASFVDSGDNVFITLTDIAGHEFENSIRKALAYGWIYGYEDNTFRPDELITRAEAAAVINRILNRQTPVLDGLDEYSNWSDNPSTKWYYFDILEASHTHTFTVENGKEVWKEIIE